MPAGSLTEARVVLRRALERIGYARANLRNEYSFADLLGATPKTQSASLVAFLGRPFTYSSAAVVLVGDDADPQVLRSLGAPLVFQHHGDALVQWKLTTTAAHRLAEIPLQSFGDVAESQRALWDPAAITRTKSARFQLSPRQLDFVDVGLLPAIDAEARRKLDEILNRIVASARAILSEMSTAMDDRATDELVSKIVFRFVAAKLLADRGDMPELLEMSASQVSLAVQTKYFGDSAFRRSSEVRAAEQRVWKLLGNSFSFANLSVDTLAHIYENTLVPESVRRARGVHGTPPEVARYVLARLPIEDLELGTRRVLEPFSGHGVFLVAALARLRELAPRDWKPRQEHAYLKRMLTGLEIDPFAVEVSRLSLMLADYPNPNGWNLLQGDAFDTDTLAGLVRESSIVVGNPPFEEFSASERVSYEGLSGTGKAQEALSRILASPPKMLGLVMPKSFLSGAHYREQRRQLVDAYGDIETVELPDNVFAHADTETVVLTAWSPGEAQVHLRYGSVSKPALREFLESRRLVTTEALVAPADLSPDFDVRIPALRHLWLELRDAPRLGSHATIHRGVEWMSGQQGRSTIEPGPGYVRGLLRVPRNFAPYVEPEVEYIDMSEMRGGASGWRWSEPKVILNAVRRSRGPWKLTAFPDREGLTVSQNFTAIWPTRDVPVEVIAAVLNGPVANAFVHTRMTGKHQKIEILSAVPLPTFTSTEMASVITQVAQYRAAAGDSVVGRRTSPESLVRRLVEIDAVVLSAYHLTPRVENELLRSFDGHKRPGATPFVEYPGADVEAALPLRMLLSLHRLSARELPGMLPRIEDSALRRAVAELRA